MDVRVGLRDGSKSKTKAEEAGLRVLPVAEATAEADLIMMLLPDTEQASVYEADITPSPLYARATRWSSRTASIFDSSRSSRRRDVDVSMVAPKGPGHRVRRSLHRGRGRPLALAVAQDATGHAEATGLAYALGPGAR